MKKFLLSLTLVVCCTAYAQELTDDDQILNEYYCEQFAHMLANPDENLWHVDIVSDPTMPCNKGDESFGSFFRRFESDKDFRISRLKSIDAVKQQFDFENSFFTSPVAEFKIGKETITGDDYVEIVDNGWLYADTDNVVYQSNTETYELTPSEDSEEDGFLDGGSLFLWFSRVDGKWMLFDVFVVG